MYVVIIYSKITNEILYEKMFTDYYRAWSYAEHHRAPNNWYEIVED